MRTASSSSRACSSSRTSRSPSPSPARCGSTRASSPPRVAILARRRRAARRFPHVGRHAHRVVRRGPGDGASPSPRARRHQRRVYREISIRFCHGSSRRSAVAQVDLVGGPLRNLVFSVDGAAVRASSERGGRMAVSFEQTSPIPPVIIAKTHRWESALQRISHDGMGSVFAPRSIFAAFATCWPGRTPRRSIRSRARWRRKRGSSPRPADGSSSNRRCLSRRSRPTMPSLWASRRPWPVGCSQLQEAR